MTGTGETVLALATGQVLLGAAFLLPLVVLPQVLAPPGRGPVSAGGLAGMLALGALGSGVAYVLNFRVIAAAGASTASAVTYLTSLFAVAVGVAFLGEHVTWNEPLGALIVLAGIAHSQGRLPIRRRLPVPSQSPVARTPGAHPRPTGPALAPTRRIRPQV